MSSMFGQNLWCEDLFEPKPVRKLYLLHVLASESAWCRQKVLLRHVLKRVDAQIVCCMSSMFGQNLWCEDLFEPKPVRKLYLLHVLASESAWCRQKALLRHVLKRVDAQIVCCMSSMFGQNLCQACEEIVFVACISV